MADESLVWLGVESLAPAFRDRRLSPREVAEAHLARIERLEPRLHAYVRVQAAEARAAARRAEEELRAGRDRGPLHGVPLAVKDLCDWRGTPTTAGAPWRSQPLAEQDACVVERLRRAGAVLLGKTALTEGAFAAHHPDLDPPRNPWAADRWPGVSSSGSGVATAAGLCVAALGSDTGGSIRFPASANGVVGLKPGYGRVPRHGVFPLAASLDHVGPLARSVADAAHVLQAIAGGDPRDPTSLPGPAEDLVGGLDHGIAGLRIGIDERYATEGLDASVTDVVLAAAPVLEEAGARLCPVRVPPWQALAGGWLVACAAEAALGHEGCFPEQRERYGPELRALLELGGRVAAVDLARIHEERLCFSGRLAALFQEVDLLLCPALGVPLPPAEPAQAGSGDPSETLRFTAPFDFSGSPTLTLPCGSDADGLPIGLQLVANRGHEARLCRAGRSYERATEWHLRRPPD